LQKDADAIRWRNDALLANRPWFASETEYHLLLAKDLGFLQEGDFQAAEQSVVVVQRMLTALVQRVQPHGRKSRAEQSQEGV
jgi:hypothetical protein